MGREVLLVGQGVCRPSPRGRGFRRPSQRAGRGWEAQPKGREGSKALSKGWEWSGCPPGGSRGPNVGSGGLLEGLETSRRVTGPSQMVWRPFRRIGRGQEAQPEEREALPKGWEALPKGREALLEDWKVSEGPTRG